MIVCNGLPEPGAFKGPVVAVGMFDGVHLGHQALLEGTRGWAGEMGVSTVALTFSRRPTGNAGGEHTPLITSLDRRLSLIEKAGIDACVVLDFSNEIVSMNPTVFLDGIIRSGLGSRHIMAGFNWRFGRNRAGGKNLLLELEKEGRLKVRFQEPVAYRGEIVSSTEIRGSVARGDLIRAGGMLGRPFSLAGEVVRGTGKGVGLGFPTANLDVEGLVRPPVGVYAAATTMGRERFLSVASLGTRPTFGNGPFVAEVHIVGFSGDLYGQTLDVELTGFIRPQKDFASPNELAAQIRKDIDAARDSRSV